MMPMEISKEERKYPLPTKKDFEILARIHEAEALDLTPGEKEQVAFIRTQLKEDWRTPLIEALDRILRKHK